LDHISDAVQGRVEVLAVRWGILARFKLWEQSVTVAARMIELAPTEVFGWIHRSYALHELKRTQEARDLLVPATELFPQMETVFYNLACYECQLNHVAEARQWWQRAVQLHDAAELRARALEDEDLRPLWPEIRQMLV
jgi:Flp pilus assembly protein TadD